jgi:hypothetical protein
MPAVISVLSNAQGLPADTRHDLAALALAQGQRSCARPTACPRQPCRVPARDGELPPAIAMVSFAVRAVSRGFSTGSHRPGTPQAPCPRPPRRRMHRRGRRIDRTDRGCCVTTPPRFPRKGHRPQVFDDPAVDQLYAAVCRDGYRACRCLRQDRHTRARGWHGPARPHRPRSRRLHSNLASDPERVARRAELAERLLQPFKAFREAHLAVATREPRTAGLNHLSVMRR